MAVNVNNVYESVLSFLNKEQRGYMTPDEFNKAAKQVQQERYEATLHEYNSSINAKKGYLSNEHFADESQFLMDRISEISRDGNLTFSGGVADASSLDSWRILGVQSTGRDQRWSEVTQTEMTELNASKLTAPSTTFPVFYKTGSSSGQQLVAAPNVTGVNDATVVVDYIPFPADPRWGYTENEEFGNFEYDANLYVENRLVEADNVKTDFTTNVSNGVDGEYAVTGTISSGGTVACRATVSSNVVTTLEISETVSNILVGATITVGTVLGSYDGTNIPVSGVSSDLVYTIVDGDLYQNSTAGSIDFRLHASEENNLILGVLAYAGIIIRDPSIVQSAAQIYQSNELKKQ